MTLDLAIPVLNEDRTLQPNVETILSFLSRQEEPLSSANIIIADNGSTDRTMEIGTDLAKRHANVRYHRLSERGVGRALKAVWSESQADVVGYFDLDLATDLQHLAEVVEAFQGGADIVYGTRLHRDSQVVGRPLRREITSRAFNGILKVYLGAKFSDGMCGFKFLRRNILARLRDHGAVSDGWFFSTELLYVAQRLGYQLHEQPVKWTDDPDSRVNIRRLTVQYLLAMRAVKKACP